jgi:hypothetical protein
MQGNLAQIVEAACHNSIVMDRHHLGEKHRVAAAATFRMCETLPGSASRLLELTGRRLW